MLPDRAGNPIAFMTLQEIRGSDYFGPVHWSTSADQGHTWSTPAPIPALGREPVAGRQDGLTAGVCDVVPQYHPDSGSVLALGHVVFYRGEYFARNEQLPRYPVYAVYSAEGHWSQRQILKWDDARGGHIYTNNCGQRVLLPKGELLLAFSFSPTEAARMVSGVRTAFDGQQLRVLEVGEPLENRQGRGLLEPSLAHFADKYWLTLRAEDNRGYLSTSADGLRWEAQTAWAWEDGTPLEMSSTQQHWLTHSHGLFLVYTRKDPSNLNVTRWRAPVWVAQVDTERRCLIKSTEQIVLPMIGDGLQNPSPVALMGNFHITQASPEEAWVTVGAWRPGKVVTGDVWLARIRWSQPNQLPLW